MSSSLIPNDNYGRDETSTGKWSGLSPCQGTSALTLLLPLPLSLPLLLYCIPQRTEIEKNMTSSVFTFPLFCLVSFLNQVASFVYPPYRSGLT